MDLDPFLHLHLHGIALQRRGQPAVMTCAESGWLPRRTPQSARAKVHQ
ncbi:MAG: hypothetical protein LH632_16590 [Rhodoferax sp.]|nr:hypothetical protein [Rhodoferax sp.]